VLLDALPARAQPIDVDLLEAVLLDALRFSAFADAREAIEAVRRARARAIVVSNWDVSLEDVLARLRLAPLLDGVVTSAQAGARKPSEAIFEQALDLFGVAPERAVHVGDSMDEDVAGARRAGIEPILLRRDGQPGPPGVRTISSLSELARDLWRSDSDSPSLPPSRAP
jgi:putative hydrolase of the HAD superfamily